MATTPSKGENGEKMVEASAASPEPARRGRLMVMDEKEIKRDRGNQNGQVHIPTHMPGHLIALAQGRACVNGGSTRG